MAQIMITMDETFLKILGKQAKLAGKSKSNYVRDLLPGPGQITITLSEPSLYALETLSSLTGKTKSNCVDDLIPGRPVLTALANHYERYKEREDFEHISLEPLSKVTEWLIGQMTTPGEPSHYIARQISILCTGPDRANAAGRLYARWIRAVMGTEDYFFEQVASEDGQQWAYFVRGPEDDEGYLRLLRQNMARELQKTSDHIRQITDIFREHGIPVKDYPAKEVEGTESDE